MLFAEYSVAVTNAPDSLAEKSNFESTVFNHEYDHLNGILHFDLSNEVYHMNREQMRAFRIMYPYEIIEK